MGIKTTRVDQMVMCSFFFDDALVENDDSICPREGGHSMRNKKYRVIRKELREIDIDLSLRWNVDSSRLPTTSVTLGR